ncbi:MAG: AtzG-like protein [Burkholderiales bacterium]
MTDAQIAAYVDAACALQGLVLAPDERLRVIAHFTRTAAMAAPLLALDLPPECEMAPVFRA